ncbi:MAG: D-tyrosyl-tRNA(Tyr) deacylase [Chitinophagales bacterium]|nr:D-tyrosyl-tRNA(Tyr) deacylase [Chitinophagales bacterium]HMU99159.1 D-aminoacyl-tRNA deacylase [Chitinophagales bacterium]HMW94797.1 D-aminoacyl-tRNA deacylase [Chitinophagales bacterium]HMY43208.1 D-aminoacyl-tRNA deacylase [Chitinophagales bacterium]HMZ68948.1 D-aminoacyl-tRNA deacylase [Chitinophagales bacterium]
MRVVIQRVKNAYVSIDAKIVGQIDKGLLVLLGIENNDTDKDVEWICKKIVQMRIFSDEADKMNLSIQDIGGNILLISQFTLFASTKKGNRPGFTEAARPEKSIPLYEKCIATLNTLIGKKIETGMFGADMQVQLINDGPVTIIMDSKRPE